MATVTAAEANTVATGPEGTTTVRLLQKRRRRLLARLGSVTVARSWWSATVARPPQGGTDARMLEGTAVAAKT
jgi:hypothetical protein